MASPNASPLPDYVNDKYCAHVVSNEEEIARFLDCKEETVDLHQGAGWYFDKAEANTPAKAIKQREKLFDVIIVHSHWVSIIFTNIQRMLQLLLACQFVHQYT